MRRLALLATLCAVCGVFTGLAQASVKFGSSMLEPPDAAACISLTMPSSSCTAAVGELPPANREPGGPVAPSDGVIVGWMVRSGNSPGFEPAVRLRVIRGNTGIATGGLEHLQKNAGFNNFASRLSVQVGDRLGLDLADVPYLQSVPVIHQTTGATLSVWAGGLADGETKGSGTVTNNELLLNATLEPDADGDGWGDETQDKCVGVPGPNQGCPDPKQQTKPLGPPIPIEPEPDTKIVKAKIKGAKATFRFTSPEKGAKFQCKLDKKPWKSCKSPKVYSGLKEGRHSFKVKAIGPTAVPDPTPAKRSFQGRALSRRLACAGGLALLVALTLATTAAAKIGSRDGGTPYYGHVFPVQGSHGERGAVGVFHAPRNGGRIHEGFDITAACGTPLVAVRNGRVRQVGYDPVLYGYFALIHGEAEKRSYFYAHMPSPAKVRKGELVFEGERIGAVGETGNAAGTGCHLHFEIHVNGVPIDPWPLLARWDRYS